ncbi:MAG TPA: hypothetical protein VFC47_11735 [Caulobacteraceae bacterium]|nr:hypothetical protein [Caulobacteraceae bacterium]
MKIVAVQGGLGNQLFCLGFAHSLLALSGDEVALDVGGYPRDRYGHAFLLGELAATMGMSISTRRRAGRRLFAAAARRLPVPGHVAEGAPPTDAAALARMSRRGVYFSGYWQDEHYIIQPEAVRREVRAFLDRRAGVARQHDLLIHYRTYKDELRVSRRGEPGPGFVQRALEAIEDRRGPVADIVLISDDPALAIERLGDLRRRITSVGAGDAAADMGLMLHARSLILGNSSFSWWGGYCGDADTVIYPTRGGLYHYPTPASRFICV